LLELVNKVIRTNPMDHAVQVKVDNHMRDPIADLDADQMVQMITNLLTNAQHAMPEGGIILVSLSDTPDEITIKVSDTGEGIRPENLDKVFDPFFTTKQVGMGTGLGLSVTHGIVKMHRGTITVESNADPAAGPTWTTFTVTLPRHAQETTSASRMEDSNP
jgi:signal transduction histidine kinase